MSREAWDRVPRPGDFRAAVVGQFGMWGRFSQAKACATTGPHVPGSRYRLQPVVFSKLTHHPCHDFEFC